MKLFRIAALAAPLFGALVAMACGEDKANLIARQTPPDGSVGEGGADGGDGGAGCELVLPAGYTSPTFETNAAQELGLRLAFDQMLAPMRAVEAQLLAGTAPTAVTKAQLEALWTAGTPSVKATTTVHYQAKVATWLGAYETALADGTYTPGAPDAGEKGGVFGTSVVDPHGVDLRQAIEKGTISAAFYNQAASLIDLGPVTVGTIDRLVAAFGAHPSFPNSDKAAQFKDVNAAAYAARRDSKDAANPGSYQKIRASLIRAKAAVEAGALCDGTRDQALDDFLAEWERSTFASAITALNDVIAKLGAGNASLEPAIFQSYAEAVGLISGWKTLGTGRRIIQDAQLDSLLQKIFAPDGAPAEAYLLKTQSFSAGTRLTDAIRDIKSVYGFSDAQVEAFKTNF